MHKLNQLVSLSILMGSLAFAAPAFAENNEGGNRFHRGRHHTRGHFIQSLPEDIQEALQDCREEESRKEKHECIKEILDSNGIEKPQKHPEISEEIRENLQACKEEESPEDRHSCAKAIFEDEGIEHPKHMKRRGRGLRMGGNLSDEVREALQACREEETREDKMECVQEVRENNPDAQIGKRGSRRGHRRQFFQNLSDEEKDALKACREEDSFADRKSCVQAIRDNQ